MDLSLYNLPLSTMAKLMNLIDLGQISLCGTPKRREMFEIHRFIKDYINYKSK